jgi:hypothetical protein
VFDRRPGHISDLNIWRVANLIIGKHGADAELEAARQQNLMLERGNYGERIPWMRIMTGDRGASASADREAPLRLSPRARPGDRSEVEPGIPP